ncbi:hypothetical protein PACTADRAFT_38083 [Pachysolen tannophilus NRRL Y-2460]|uniref:Importin N-terminal domain-containing protein n=1 Tax=Pachysolen tannophilus NRRL Y-2460 TaxID=669874 RepID=A0A1E4U2K0_PACTA|nr:hypothetical protein PACTADRAFT_38083 [Pachysolen tannophilus NRRL Y-2460]
MSWSPDPQAVQQLTHVLAGTLSTSSKERAQAQEALDQARLLPDLDNYLLHILVNEKQANSQIRASAGLLLKNNILKNFTKKDQLLQKHVLDEILKGIIDNDGLVRNITGNVITSLFSMFGVELWPQVLSQLMDIASGAAGSIQSQEGAMSALSKICEDSIEKLDKDYNGERPLNYMIPKFIELTQSPSAKVRAQAILCINQGFRVMSQALLAHLNSYLSRLFVLATDESPSVRRNICSAFSNILETIPDKLLPHLDGVINYAIHSINDNNEEVSLEACEFLLSLSSSEIPQNIIKPKLPMIISTLLEKMVYSEVDIFLIEEMDSKNDADIEDKDNDIKPQMAKGKDSHKVASKDDKSNNRNGDTAFDADDDTEDEEDDQDGDLSEWNLRKCAAATLDVFASIIPEEIMGIVLPLLKDRITSPQWPIREAAILAFGAISEGCLELARDQLPELVPFLVDRLQDKEPRVRQITCWTLGRYSPWVCGEAHKGGQYAAYFMPTFQAVMMCALDNKKIVQEAACSSLANFIEAGDSELIGQLVEPLLTHFQKCFVKYQRKNLVILYDAVQTFVEKTGDKLSNNDKFIEVLLPPLIEKWHSLADDDKDLWPLLECMSSVAASLGESFAPYGMPVYDRAFKILANCVEQEKLCHSNPLIDYPEKDFMVTSIDLIDGLVQGLKLHSGRLILQNDQKSSVPLMQLLLSCFEDPTDDVRQSAYALLGDLAIFNLEEIVRPYLHLIIISIGNEISNRSFNSSAVVNNATWALGEIALRLSSQDLQPYLSNLVAVLLPLLNSTDVQSTVLENAAITIGRIGISSPQHLSQYLSEFLSTWSAHMKYLEENDEKDTAFRGMCNIIGSNPTNFLSNASSASGKSSLSKFLECIAYYEYPSDELSRIFVGLLNGYKSTLGDSFEREILSYMDGESREILKIRYGI